MSKNIIFLSGIDFKDKSIQVIRKTPEAYVKHGWNVTYVVGRDNCPGGNYFYESEIDIPGIKTVRTYWPLGKLRNMLPRPLNLICSKLASFIIITKLFLLARKEMKKIKFDVVYGYELQGVLAMNLLRRFGLTKNSKTVSRFQGTFLYEMFAAKQYARLFFNFDLIRAIKAKSDMLVMTNDGTQGDKAVEIIKKKRPYKMCFWINGVDFEQSGRDGSDPALLSKYKKDGQIILLSISRLVGWKRVERGLAIMNELKKRGFSNFKYLIVGEGECREQLESLARTFGIEENVEFIGAVKNHVIKDYLSIANFFVSMYDSSNVGNPLLEAIRFHKVIVTLNNGDTSSWITHKENGFIYDVDEHIAAKAANDIIELSADKERYDAMVANVKKLEELKLWNWDERLKAEVNTINSL